MARLLYREWWKAAGGEPCDWEAMNAREHAPWIAAVSAMHAAAEPGGAALCAYSRAAGHDSDRKVTDIGLAEYDHARWYGAVAAVLRHIRPDALPPHLRHPQDDPARGGRRPHPDAPKSRLTA